jgi:hypothetical protein
MFQPQFLTIGSGRPNEMIPGVLSAFLENIWFELFEPNLAAEVQRAR